VPEHPDNNNAPVIVGSEIDTALAFLDYLRQSVLRKLDGLTEDEARRPMVGSGTSLLGLVKHLANVESYWIERRFAGLETTRTDDGFALTADDTIASVRRLYLDTTARTDAIITGSGDPEQALALGRHGLTLRWALAHVAEETGRHAGHADIVRELLDGTTGR
jgi:uncharacterized damage-inducible protein DinB